MYSISPGTRFGHLVAVEFVPGYPKPSWKCRCDCGNEAVVFRHRLLSGNTKSCGCRKRNVLGDSRRKHGACRTPEYVTWCAMKSRCNNVNNRDYADYGGRGISVCERWNISFEAFVEDIGVRPSPRSTLERKNVNGNYEPGNCCWATQKTQTRNKRTNVILDFHGELRCLAEWCEILGKNPGLVWDRLNRGWSVKDALTLPKMNRWSRRKKATV